MHAPSWNARHRKSRHPFIPPAQQFIWQQKQQTYSAPGKLPVECGVTGQYYKTPYFHPRHRHQPFLNGPAKNILGSAPVSDVSAPFCTNGVWPLLRIVSGAQRYGPFTKLSFIVRSIHLIMWSARPDGTGWWSIQMAAQHLPRDPEQPSSGLKELTQTTKKMGLLGRKIENQMLGESAYEVLPC